ncbi:DUF4335 domain-containing protein [Synechococcus moorigangaii CMS01]|nr:DUF4335 domain-containing protein [Synechococcus moorigangaii CMS01]
MVSMLSPTLIRRYTPPTCSLEVTAKTSALSQWTGKPLIKELNFALSFDDPRLGPERRVVITGDRQQLETLANVVNDYVQGFLQNLNPDWELRPPVVTIGGDRPGAPGGSPVATFSQPQLMTQGLLSHVLHLGRLATPESGPSLQLNITQLHDLAEALETYSADMVALPGLTASHQRRTMIRWGTIAASLLLAVGVGNTIWQQQQSPETSSTLSLENSDGPRNQAELVPPNPHASYTFSPVPESTDTPLEAQQAPPQTVDLNQAPTSGDAPPQPSVSPSTAPPAPIASTAPSDSPDLSLAPSMGGQLARSTAADQAEAFSISGSGDPNAEAIAAARLNPQQQLERYFQTQWQSPADLREVLEYRLKLDDKGAIQTVLPIGKAAELYQAQLPFLNTGQNVGATLPPEARTFRLVLNPDGRVQTFTETPR